MRQRFTILGLIILALLIVEFSVAPAVFRSPFRMGSHLVAVVWLTGFGYILWHPSLSARKKWLWSLLLFSAALALSKAPYFWRAVPWVVRGEMSPVNFLGGIAYGAAILAINLVLVLGLAWFLDAVILWGRRRAA